jgi:V-type H+-transporting ATPase subunit a
MYKEINPAVFAMVSFPFLFGVMYGDMGHGGIYLILGILLVMLDSKIRQVPGIGSTVSMVRYLILLMGIFAVFNGFIYNEFFAISIDFFGSCYGADVEVISVSGN